MEESMTNSGTGPSQTVLPAENSSEPIVSHVLTPDMPVVAAHVERSTLNPQPLLETSAGESAVGEIESDSPTGPDGTTATVRKRRRGSRGGQRRRKSTAFKGSDSNGEAVDDGGDFDDDDTDEDNDEDVNDDFNEEANDAGSEGDVDDDTDERVPSAGSAGDSPTVIAAAKTPRPVPAPPAARSGRQNNRQPQESSLEPELPERLIEGKISDPAVAARALVGRRPQVGDTFTPSPPPPPPGKARTLATRAGDKAPPKAATEKKQPVDDKLSVADGDTAPRAKKKRPSRSKKPSVAAQPDNEAVVERKRGRERNGRPVGRYLMAVQVRDNLTQVAVLEGRSLIEHYVSRPADDVSQIHGNIYLGRVQNILPGMEAAFVDIATPKNAVLYRGDVQYDSEDLLEPASGAGKKKNDLRIEQMLKSKQLIVCQVTKNPIGAKGARLTQDVSLPGRFVVLIPNSSTFGISKRLPDDERKRLRGILDRVKPAEHGLIVRTAAESATEEELRADVLRLSATWNEIARKAEQARKSSRPALLYREPPLAVRVIREEFNAEYRNVVIDDRQLYDDIHGYVTALNPELADRVEFYDAAAEGLPLYERNHIHEQVHKALDRKVWLPSGGSLIIEHTEALTVIDVNTGKNVGSTNLEETVFYNNLEAADEIARQLRLRDIGGIIVIDFIDMEIRDNRKKVVDSFRAALSRDKTRTQVFDITELGLVEMTRKRIGEGLLTSFADQCPNCEGRGVMIDLKLLE